MENALLDKQNIVPAKHEDDVSQYVSEIRRYPLLNQQQERELAAKCAKGDPDAIRTMVNSNLRLAVSIAREYAGRGVPLLDLIQEGNIGLLEAAKKFDRTMDCRFSTYASKWIRQCVIRYLQDHGSLIRVPPYTQQRVYKVLKTKATLKQTLDADPEIGQIAAQTGLTKERTRYFLLLGRLMEISSLDVAVGGENDSLQTLLQDEQTVQPQEQMARRELKNTMEALLEKLPERYAYVLKMRFGLADGQCHTFEEISAQLGVSKERARQIEDQAMKKLQKLGNDLGLEDFLD